MRFKPSSGGSLKTMATPHLHVMIIFVTILLLALLTNQIKLSIDNLTLSHSNSDHDIRTTKAHHHEPSARNSTTTPRQRPSANNTSALPSPVPPAPQPAQPLVTVVLTAYNVEDYISDTVNATLHQTYQNLQIFVIDDASTDDTTRIIASLTASDPRVKHIRLSSRTYGGSGTPANIGIDLAQGKYLAFVDGDDIPLPDFIETLVDASEKSGADFTYCNFQSFRRLNGRVREAYDLMKWPRRWDIKRSRTEPLSPSQHPATFGMSPVPWRKLYRTAFLKKYHLRNPEGDFFFEDNSLHWLVNMYATKISFVDEVLVQHRVGRESQTTSAFRGKKQVDMAEDEHEEIVQSVKGASIIGQIANRNYIGYQVENCPEHVVPHCDVVRDQFFRFLDATDWVVDVAARGGDEMLAKKMMSLRRRTTVYWRNRLFERGKGVRRIIMLSIIVPTYNVEMFLPAFMKMLEDITIKHEVIFVDNDSTDGTLIRLKELTRWKRNMYILHTRDEGAGRARNLGLLFAEGRYVIFLDSDDVFDATALEEAVAQAEEEDLELMMVRYKLEYAKMRKDGSVEVKSSEGMFKSDQARWAEMDTDLEGRKAAAGRLTNYPWNKLVRREMLMRGNVFFGGTTVNNDVQYHWHALQTARTVGKFEGTVVVHRKFSGRDTLTDTVGEGRLALPDALAATNRVLVHAGLDGELKKAWKSFVQYLLKWGRARVGKEFVAEYEQKSEDLKRFVEEGKGELLRVLS